MIRSKKLSLALIGLVLVFALMGCNADNETDLDEEQVTTEDVKDEEQEVEDTDEDEVETEVEDEEDIVEEEKPEESADEDTAIDPDVAMIRESDYISKIKLIKKGSDTTEIKILENIKGNLSNDNLPAMEDLQLNRAYVVFLKDADGSAVLTDAENGLILLEGDNHEIFEKINKEIHNN